MPSLEQISMKYAELIINASDKLDAISEVKNKIDNLTYQNGDNISEYDKEKIWDEIEVIVKNVEEKNKKELYEHKVTSTLDVISLVRGKKKKK